MKSGEKYSKYSEREREKEREREGGKRGRGRGGACSLHVYMTNSDTLKEQHNTN